MKIKQYVDKTIPAELTVADADKLMRLEFVQRAKTDGDGLPFLGYSQLADRKRGVLLFAEYGDGTNRKDRLLASLVGELPGVPCKKERVYSLLDGKMCVVMSIGFPKFMAKIGLALLCLNVGGFIWERSQDFSHLALGVAASVLVLFPEYRDFFTRLYRSHKRLPKGVFR